MICRALEISPDQIMVLRTDQEEEIVTVVIDRGIKGCPKYRLTFGELIMRQLKPRKDAPSVQEILERMEIEAEASVEQPAPPVEAKVKRGTSRK